jgi:murein DD-endopeptidase MepM/ murein hydrolase activator NlpD
VEEKVVVLVRAKGRLYSFLFLCAFLAACSSGTPRQSRPGQGWKTTSISPERRPTQRVTPEKRALARTTPGPLEGRRSLPKDNDSREGDFSFRWPVEGRITSGFGPRRESFHDGIDIAAPRGTPVCAVADGEVIFSNVLHGYGNIVIVRHRHGYVTVYAHNQRNLVQEGAIVRRGQRLAEVGQSGRATGPHLHFEVRKDNLARNPLRYLPEDRQTVSQDR